jgi:hypothetical protein
MSISKSNEYALNTSIAKHTALKHAVPCGLNSAAAYSDSKIGRDQPGPEQLTSEAVEPLSQTPACLIFRHPTYTDL